MPEDLPARRAAADRKSAITGGLVVVLIASVLMSAKLWRPDARFDIQNNVQIGEAQAWWHGRLDLPERLWDTALQDGRVYGHFPPLFTFIVFLCYPFFGDIPHGIIVIGIFLPVLLLAYLLCLKLAGSPIGAVILTIGLVFGTSLYPVLEKTLRGARPYAVNQSLAVIGLLLFLNEYFGKRRAAMASCGFAIAALSRQLTVFYAIPLLWLATHAFVNAECTEAPSGLKRRVLASLTAVFIVGGVTLFSNTVKFGSPLNSGYMYVYNDRPEDDFSRDARAHGLFSAHYLPRNLYYANLGLPNLHTIRIEGHERRYLRPNHMGTGIWWTTPLLLWLIVDFRRILREPASRMLLIAVGLVFAALMCYHSTGADQRGFNRYSLDYLPALYALAAPRSIAGKRKWITLLMIAWSVVYFRCLI